MKALKRIVPILCLALPLVAAGCSSSGGSTGAGGSYPADRRARTANAVLDLASMLGGSFEGVSPGNNLNLVITGTVSPSAGDTYNLSVLVTGRYQDRNVWEQGVLHLENQGRDVYLAYIPHFDPTAGGLSLQALRFTRQELESACGFYVAPAGDGFAGNTRDAVSCARAIPGAVGKWSFQIEPGSIRIRNVETGETLRFRKRSK